MALAPPQGHAVLAASALRHAGERWVLVLFIISREMKYGEHVRHFKARALRAAEEGDEDEEIKCLTLARALCDDADHELLYDQAVGEHERGQLQPAIELYEKADAIAQGRDIRIRRNLAAARAALSPLTMGSGS